MPPNPHTPGSAGTPDPQVDVSAEAERARNVLASKLLGDISALTIQQHDKIVALLGVHTPADVKQKGDLEKNKWILKAKPIDLGPDKPSIAKILAEKRIALAALLPETLNGLTPDNLDFDGSGTGEPMSEFVIDPDSDDAKWLWFYFTQYGGPGNTAWQQILRPKAIHPDEAKKLKELEALHTEYATIVQDPSFHNLTSRKRELAEEHQRMKDVTTAAAPTTPSTVATSAVSAPAIAINLGEQQRDNTAQVQQAFARMREIGAEQTALDGKETDLKNRLETIDKRGQALTGASSATYIASPGIAASIGTLTASTKPPFSWTSQRVVVDANDHSIEEWMTDADTADTLVRLRAKVKRGAAKLSAGAALDQMIRSNIDATEPNATEAEKAKLVKEMRAAFAQKPATTPAAATGGGAASDAPKKFMGSEWLHSMGATTAYNWYWNKNADGTDKQKEDKGEQKTSMLGSFLKYMQEDDKNFLGFDAAKKKKD